MLGRAIAASCLFLLGAVPASAQELKQLETDDLQLVWFHPTEDYLAPYVARSFENSADWQQKVFGWKPDGRVNVLLKDFADYGNAGARASPNNALIVDIAPFSFSFETFVATERMYTLMNHELTHVANMDQATERERYWRRFFSGKVQINPDHPETLWYHYITTPRDVVPRWWLEGAAVFFETWMSGGMGRAQGAYDEMVFRAMVRDGAHFYDPAGLAAEGTKVDFQVGVNNYLYGTRFFSYLALTYSPEKVVRWLTLKEGDRRYYADAFEDVFGKPMEQVWSEWIAWEHEFQQKNLAAVRQNPVTPHKAISKRGLGSISRAYFDPESGRVVAAFRYPGVAAYLGTLSLSDGSIEPLRDVKGPMLYKVTSLAYDPATHTAFYTTDNNANYRDVMTLDTKTGAARMLFKDVRIGDLAFNRVDRSLYGIRHLNGLDTLVRMEYPYTEYHQVHSWPYGEIVYDLDISPDGRLLSASHAAIDGSQALYVMSLEALAKDDPTPVKKFDFESAVPEGFVFAPDGRSLYGSSYYTGVSNIYRYDLESGKIEALSNAETGFFRPTPLPDGRLLVFDYTGQGLVPGFIEPKPLEDLSAITFLGAQVAAQYPIIKDWNAGPPSRVDLKARTRSEGEYDSLKEITLHSAYPVIEGYKDSVALGIQLNFQDPIGLDRIGVGASYSPDTDLDPGERLHFDAKWRHRQFRASYAHNGADFYDLFGPTKQSRRGNTSIVGWDKPLIFDTPRTLDMDLSAQWNTNIDTLPAFQDVPVTADRVFSLIGRLKYSYIVNSLGNVDDEKGMKWDVNVISEHVHSDTITGIYGGFAAGMPFGDSHQSIWWRNHAAWSDGRSTDPFANFFLGGFGNNWVDNGEVKRYRQPFSFPGFDISEIGGRTFLKSMLEYNMAPWRFSEIGTPANYLSWARPALFAGGLVVEPNLRGLERRFYTLGAQLDFQFYVMHSQEMTFSLGYASGWEDGAGRTDEFMGSLKVLY